jgi:hypothetical protein
MILLVPYMVLSFEIWFGIEMFVDVFLKLNFNILGIMLNHLTSFIIPHTLN